MKLYDSTIVPKGCPDWHGIGVIVEGPKFHYGQNTEVVETTVQLPVIRSEAYGRWVAAGEDTDKAVREEAAKANAEVVKALKEQIDELERLVKHFEIEAVNQGFLNGDS